MKKIKVALVHVFFPPQTHGGATTVLKDNLEILIEEYKDSFEIVGFTTDYDQSTPYRLGSYTFSGIRVYKVGVQFRENMDWHYEDLQIKKIFSEFLKFEKPDIVHFHCIQRLTASVVEEALHQNIPTFVTIHDAWWISDYQFLVDGQGNVYPSGHPDMLMPLPLPKGIVSQESIVRRAYLANLLNSAKLVFVVSKSFHDIYKAHGINNLLVTANGIKTRPWIPRTGSISKRVRIGHIGGMSKHKGYHLFKKAFVRSAYENLEVVVIDLSKEYGYTRKNVWGSTPVTFLGKFPQDEVHKLYSQFDVLAAPSIWPESYGLVTREAAAAGLWVIASSLGAIGEDVHDNVNGFIISVDKFKDLQRVLSIIDTTPDRFLSSPPMFPVRHVRDQVKQIVKEYYKCLNVPVKSVKKVI